MGRVEVVECLKVFLVFFLYIRNGEEVDAHCCMSNGCCTTDACTGDVMGVGGETLLVEDIVACFYHALVIDIYVGHVNPGSDKVALHRHCLGRFIVCHRIRVLRGVLLAIPCFILIL